MGPSTKIVLGMTFGSIEMDYMVCEKKQQRDIAFLSGFALVAYPYFVPNVVLVILIGNSFYGNAFPNKILIKEK